MEDEMKHILWIHGFAGRPNNDKILYMMKKYPEYDWYAIEVDHHALASMQKINEYIKTHKVDLVAGTSCGGYYAMCAEFDGPKLVVNPVVDPIRDLRQFLGKNSYKPGRPDGQLEFDFTEEMLQEFGQLTMQPIDNVLCHYTLHDHVLGEDIKKDYEKRFYHLQQMDEKVLNNHFLTFNYIKIGLKEAFKFAFDMNTRTHRNAYHVLGTDYLRLPKDILDKVIMAYSHDKTLNYKKLVGEIEQCIKDVKDEYYREKESLGHHRYSADSDYEATIIQLLKARKHLMNKMFVETQETFDKMKAINEVLLDLTNKMNDKLRRLYDIWLNDNDTDWNIDCEVKGVIFADDYDDNVEDDGSGSDYKMINELIADIDQNVLYTIEFSGSHDASSNAQRLQSIDKENPNWYCCCGGRQPFGDFLMCKAFIHLYRDGLYSKQDILRILYFWCDAAVVHQRIINNKGELEQ